ncbi:M36 family metallopeptidase [Intrasporangium sp.]|uniref:M36 family metallopeptidase n=1 Tax=Intrasporangium sp. TaxID=1925024 RepID=UPI00293A5F9B|nr:M36 family metallopeptidase [Intrasporangium sp.]MDV3221462.1 M36 family metallopeptidase [Intrasporangium sp.]
MTSPSVLAAGPPDPGPDGLGASNAPGASPGAASAADAPVVRRDSVTGAIESIRSDRTGLTAPSKGAPADLALAFVRARAKDFGLSPGHARNLYVAKELALTSGASAIHVGQQVGGLRVNDALLTVVVAADGRVLSAAGHLAAGAVGASASRAPALNARQALDKAAGAQGAKARRPLREADVSTSGRRTFPNVYGVGNAADRPVSTELVWQPSDHGRRLTLAWVTDIESSGQEWWETVVDARTGAVLDRTSRYAHAGPEGTVTREQHPEAPGATRQVTAFTGLDGSWVSGTTTSGNNVNAYLDRNDDDANNEYQPTAADQHFNYTFTDAWRTTADVNSVAALDADRDAAITQLFYYTNVMHDWLYGHGFDEASGNFQVDNFGRGGSGGDPVLAEAQDGYDFGCDDGDGTPNETEDRCRNNANFGTPGDGASPRMQMYMWIPSRPFRDGDFDGDVIAHEYGHGVSSRLVGGGNLGYNGGDQRGALGEGWSDVVSYLKWGDAVIGEYVTGNATTGIRAVAYDNSNLTFQNYDTNSGSGHGNGQIWASALYDIRAQIPGGVEAMASLVLDGMKATPANPTFIDARDGLLTADGGANRCLIWSAFAGRGLGTGSSGGLDEVPSASDDIPAECLPTADADGPYVTPEGTDVQLDGTGSASGTDPSAGAITTYEWDLDNDGAYDDATGPTPDFTAVGQDGAFPIGLRVTDAFGNTSTDTSSVTVTNVAPTVVVDAITPIDELGTVTVTGTVTDPGWLDPLTATITFDDGAAPVALAGNLENVRPDATLTFSVQHQYGDNGDYTVEVCAADDDTTGNCGSNTASVANVDPTAVIDTSGEQVYDGVSAFILEAGEDLTVPVGSEDPGSDDLTFEWAWGDGTTDSQTSLVNPPALDPPKSPSIQPRDVDLSETHAYGDACLYTLTTTVTDDDGGSGNDSAAVLVTGNADVSKGHGWWLNQYRDKPPNDFTPAQLQCYLDIVGYLSLVFDEDTDASTRAAAAHVLNAPAKSPAEVIFDQMALGAWLNFANGSVKLDTAVDTDGDGVDDSTFGAAMLTAETIRMNPASTSAQIKAQKDIVERIALQSAS